MLTKEDIEQLRKYHRSKSMLNESATFKTPKCDTPQPETQPINEQLASIQTKLQILCKQTEELLAMTDSIKKTIYHLQHSVQI